MATAQQTAVFHSLETGATIRRYDVLQTYIGGKWMDYSTIRDHADAKTAVCMVQQSERVNSHYRITRANGTQIVLKCE